MAHFTAILLYPDYIANTYGKDTWMSTVCAETPAHALAIARETCMTEIGDAGGIEDPHDLHCIALIAGHHTDLAPTLA